MQCARCGRELKDKKSIDRGYGPSCWKKVQETNQTEDEDHEGTNDRS
jgi:hypothetical protein